MIQIAWRYQSVIIIRHSKKDRQHNGQKKKDKRTNNDHQNTTQKTKDRSTRTPLLWILGNSFVIDTLLHTISPKYDSVDSLLIIWKQTKLSAGDNIYIVFAFHIIINMTN